MASAVEILVKARDLTARAFSSAVAGAKRMGAAIGRGLQTGIAGLKRLVVGAGAAGAALFAVGAKLVTMYQKQVQANAKLAAVLKTTGNAAGFTATELKIEATRLQELTGAADEATVSAQAMLASFTNVRGDVFKRATVAALDMGAAMKNTGVDVAEAQESMLALGIALNDPVEGLSRLGRAGVRFTDVEEKMIKAMAEAGDIAGAQDAILKKIEGRFGGTAEAVNKASHGIIGLKTALGEAGEAIGGAIAETSAFDSVIKRVTEAVKELIASGKIELWAENAKTALSGVAVVADNVGGALGWIKEKVGGAAAFWGGFSGAQGSLAERARAGTEAMETTPAALAEDKAAALARIKEAKAFQEAVDFAAEMEAMLAAKPAAAEAAAEAAQEEVKAAVDLVALEKERLDTLQEIERARMEDAKAAADAATDAMRAKLADAAMTADERREKSRVDRDAEKASKRTEDVAARARETLKRGGRLTGFQRRQLELADARAALEAAVQAGNVAQQNLEQVNADAAKRQRADMIATLAKIEADLAANLRGVA